MTKFRTYGYTGSIPVRSPTKLDEEENMKIEQTVKEFTPITLTIESKEELQLLLIVLEHGYNDAEYDSPEEALAEKIQKTLEGYVS